MTRSVLVGLFALLLVLPGTALAQGAETLAGQVVNGTAGGAQPGRLEVTLEVTESDRQVATRTTTAAEDGTFAFTDIPPGADLHYSIRATYQDVPYRATVTGPLPADPIRLTVFETTSSIEQVRVLRNSVVVTGADGEQRWVEFLEMLVLGNQGDRTVVPDIATTGPMDLLRFSLPAGATNLDVLSDLPKADLIQVDRGFALVGPVPPGDHQMLYSYRVPYQGSSLAFDRSFPLGAGVFRLLVPESLPDVTVTDLQEQAPVTLGQTRYRVLEGQDIARGAGADMHIGGLPQPSVLRTVARVSPVGRWGQVALLALLGAGLAAALALGLVRRRAPAAEPALAASSTEALVQAIAVLDDRHARGEIGEAEYRGQREVLKGQWRQAMLGQQGAGET